LLKRPSITIDVLRPYLDRDIDEHLAKQIEIEIKYEGYINKAKRDAQHLHQMDNVRLPEDMNYNEVVNLSLEARQKLTKIMPMTMGQASRISGVNPADIAVLAVYLEQKRRES
ncbi:MAG: tRNA uridine-5-carboxymethylaminomethyl(34) synthesis enzyme MnmG, partial [Longicatena sp.]